MLSTQVGDAELIMRVRAGEPMAFDVLARRHRAWLVQHCRPLLGDDCHEAEDIAQESLIRLHSALLRDERELRVRPWLSVVARHLCIDLARRRMPIPIDDLPDAAVQDEDPFDVDPALAEAWARLAARHRDVLTHRELVGLSYDEIAAVMGTTVAAVETLLFRARASLRKHYKKAGGTLLGCGAYLFSLDRLGRGPGPDPQVLGHLTSCVACRQATDSAEALALMLRGASSGPPGRPSLLEVATEAANRVITNAWAVLTPGSHLVGQAGTALTAAAVALSPIAAPGAASPQHDLVPSVADRSSQSSRAAGPEESWPTHAGVLPVDPSPTPTLGGRPWDPRPRWSPRPRPTYWSWPTPRDGARPTYSPMPMPTWSPSPRPTESPAWPWQR